MWCCSLPLPRPRHKGVSDVKDQKRMPADSCEAKTQSESLAVPSGATAERSQPEGASARRHARHARAYIALVMVALAATLGAATYAWFTNNMKVNTNSVSVHSDTSKLVLELGYSIDYEDEKEDFEPDEADTVELINGERMPWEQVKRDGIDYIALYYVNKEGEAVQILDAELA